MRKTPIDGFGKGSGPSVAGSWLNLEELATAELSSEDPEHPFEEALRLDTAYGWKASYPGPQLIRLRFDTPQSIKHIRLRFQEETVDRSQEIALFATTVASPRRELLRQQWVFSRGGSTTELQDFFLDIKDLTLLELEIDPGRHDKQVFASLQSIQIE